MSDAKRNLEKKQAHARSHPVRKRILEVFPKDRGEAPTASVVVELFGEEFSGLTADKAHYHLATLKDADLLAGPQHRVDQDIQLARGVGAAVKELRLERGISTEDLAHRAKLPHSDVVAIEAGSAEEFWGDLRRLAPVLGIGIDSLIALAEQLAQPADDEPKRQGPSDDPDSGQAPQPEP